MTIRPNTPNSAERSSGFSHDDAPLASLLVVEPTAGASSTVRQPLNCGDQQPRLRETSSFRLLILLQNTEVRKVNDYQGLAELVATNSFRGF